MLACADACIAEAALLLAVLALAIQQNQDAIAQGVQKLLEMLPPLETNTFAKDERTVGEVLKGKRGSIKQAPLPPGSPSWDDILDKPMNEIEDGAKRNLPGYREIRKLLRMKDYDK